MLDFGKLLAQIEAIDRESLLDRKDWQETLAKGQAAFAEAAASGDEFAQKLLRNSQTVLWPVATPLSPIGQKITVCACDDAYTVVAADGSQIMPSHHEVHTCYLLNIGIAAITYGGRTAPVLESIPFLYSRPDDLYPLVDRRRFHIDELYVSMERTILEIETLADKALLMKSTGVAVLALYDGSLIPWSVEKLSDGYQNRYVERLSAALERLQQQAIPLVGYLSQSRSADLVNCLRIWQCPYPSSNCRLHCDHLNEDDFPCSEIWPASDRQLLREHLQPADCSAIFLSGAGVSRFFGKEDRICFSYLNVGEEIARLEFPRWVYDDELLASALSMVLSQTKKGLGYPVSLAEAHHLAVIRGADRDQFFDLMTRQLLALGVSGLRTSIKEAKKRNTFV